MSIAHRQREIVERPATARRADDVTVRWSVAAGALTPGARGAAAVEITVRRADDGSVWLEAAAVTAGERRVVRSAGPFDARAWWADGAGLEHIEAGPTLRATMRAEGAANEGAAVLFAQTDVLGELGLGGGRYDRPG